VGKVISVHRYLMIVALGGLALSLSQGVEAGTSPFEKGVQRADATTASADSTTLRQGVPAWLVGAWVLVRCDQVYPDGRLVEVYGPHPQGMWIIDTQGHYMMQVARDEQARQVVSDAFHAMPDGHPVLPQDANASYGWLNVDSQQIHTHRAHALSPQWQSEDGNSSYALQGDQLTYSMTMPTGDGGAGVRGVVVWRRLTI
jgi:hypothetical protein